MKQSLTRLVVVFLILIVGGIALLPGGEARSAASEPVITSLSTNMGPAGQSLIIYGSGFVNGSSNVVSWDFGEVTTFSSGNSGSGAISVTLLRRCPAGEGDVCGSFPTGHLGYIDIRVSNTNGTSKPVKFLILPNGSTSNCYFEDGGSFIKLNDCSSSSCNAGYCQEPAPSATPTPTPTTSATPTPTPTPTPISTDDDDEDISTSSSNKSSSSNSSSSNSLKKVVAGASVKVKGPTAADREALDFIKNSLVVATVDSLYTKTYGRRPSFCASHYWKHRARTDKATRSKLAGAMAWQKLHGRDPAFRSCTNGRVAGTSTKTPSPGGKISGKDINRLFRLTHGGVNPTVAQNKYWLGRLKAKPTQGAMVGAMRWHVLAGTGN